MNSKTVTVVSISAIIALGIGIAIGTSLNQKGILGGTAGDGNNNFAPEGLGNIAELPVEELGSKLSNIMLPEEEFTRLEAAILQTGMGLFMAQAQQAGVTVTDEAQADLKKSISEKYSRKYFSDMNAGSMQELSKPDLISIISFYNTEAGQKFLKLSPKIIQTTMTAVQSDLSAWLPKTIEALVVKLKGGAPSDKPEENKDLNPNEKALEKAEDAPKS